jgi:hypothetical protein
MVGSRGLGKLSVGKVLAERADDYWNSLSTSGAKRALENLFMDRLIQILKDGAIIRRRARRNECTRAEWDHVDKLASEKWRLIATSRDGSTPIAELPHDDPWVRRQRLRISTRLRSRHRLESQWRGYPVPPRLRFVAVRFYAQTSRLPGFVARDRPSGQVTPVVKLGTAALPAGFAAPNEITKLSARREAPISIKSRPNP